jgi:hypothetical protein
MANPNQNEIRSIYEELKGLLHAIPNQSWFDDEGFSKRANDVIKRAEVICPDIVDIDSYKIVPVAGALGRGPILSVASAKANLHSLMGRIKGMHGFEDSPASGGTTFIQNQQQSQSLSVVLDFQEKAIAEIPKHAEGTKERTFLEAFKATLPTVKTLTDIMSAALTLGGRLGLDPVTIHKLLGL